MADKVVGTYYSPSAGYVMGDTIFEDVENIIQNISPTDTPFVSSLGKTKVTNTLHAWLEDEMKAPTGTNAVLEGADPESTDRLIPDRLSNYTQIMQDTFRVSGSMDAVNTIGRQEESKYQLTKCLKYIATELEYAAINNSTAAAGDAVTARTFKGLEGFVTTNDKSFAAYNAGNDFSETVLMSMAQACFQAGGNPTTLLVGPHQARKISGWNQQDRITINSDASEKALVMAVMALETPFGRMKVVIDRWIKQDDDTGTKYDRVYLYEPSKMKIGWLRPFKTTELAKTGDSRKYQTVGECTFICYSEKAAAKCKKCATD